MFDWLFRNRRFKQKVEDARPGKHETYQMDATLPNGKPIRIAETVYEGESQGYSVTVGRRGEKSITSNTAPAPVDSQTVEQIIDRALNDDRFIYP